LEETGGKLDRRALEAGCLINFTCKKGALGSRDKRLVFGERNEGVDEMDEEIWPGFELTDRMDTRPGFGSSGTVIGGGYEGGG